MRRTLAALVAVAAVTSLAVSALPAGAHTAAPAKRRNIVALAAGTPQLSTLVKLVKTAGLVKALSAKTQLTVFAPTNAAFAKVPKKTLSKLSHDKKLLKAVLLYHVAKGDLTAAKVIQRKTITTLEGATLKVAVRHGKVYVNQAQVIVPNVKASNGVVHLINRVLIPPAG